MRTNEAKTAEATKFSLEAGLNIPGIRLTEMEPGQQFWPGAVVEKSMRVHNIKDNPVARLLVWGRGPQRDLVRAPASNAFWGYYEATFLVAMFLFLSWG